MEQVNTEQEIWKDVPGYGGHYQASSLGRIRVKERTVRKWHKSGKHITQNYKQRILNPTKADKYGHLSVHIGYEGKKITAFVHRLVLFAFVGPAPHGMECCHKNGIAWDNRPSNLRWCTHASNNRDRLKHNRYSIGDEHPMAKFSNNIILDVYKYLKNGGTGVEASELFGISTTHISRIKNGKHGVFRSQGNST